MKTDSLKNKHDLTQGGVYSHIFKMSIPASIGIFAIIASTLADMYFISRVGMLELAAVVLGVPLTSVFFFCVKGVGAAFISISSSISGSKNSENLRNFVGDAFYIAMATGIIFVVLCLLVMPFYLHIVGAEGELMSLAKDYLVIWIVGGFFLAVSLPMNNIIRATGDAMTPTYITLSAAIISVMLDPVFIFGFLFIPAMGVGGAALATAVSHLVAMLICLFVLRQKKLLFYGTKTNIERLKKTFKSVFAIALPSALSGAIIPISASVMLSLISAFGENKVFELSAFGVSHRLDAFLLVVIMGLSVGMSPIIGQNFGAGNISRVKEAINKGLGLMMVWCFISAAILYFFGKNLVSLFTDQSEIIPLAVIYMTTIPLTNAFGVLIDGWSTIFTMLGNAKRALLMTISRYFGVQIPLCFIGSFYWGFEGLIYGIALSNIIIGVTFHLLNVKHLKKLIDPN